MRCTVRPESTRAAVTTHSRRRSIFIGTKHCQTREMSFRPELPTLMVAGVQRGGTPVQRHDARSISS